eukprot:gene14828-31493_t
MFELNQMQVNGVTPEVKRQNPDGSLQSLPDNYMEYVGTKSKLASCAQTFMKLDEDDRIKVAIKIKDAANKLFSESNFKDAMDNYLQALMAFDYTSINSGDNTRILNTLTLPLLCNLAACCNELKEYHKAIKFSDQALLLNPLSSKAHLRRGQSHMKLGDYTNAEIDFLASLSHLSNKNNDDNLKNKIQSYIKTINQKKYEDKMRENKMKLALRKAFNTDNKLPNSTGMNEFLIEQQKDSKYFFIRRSADKSHSGVNCGPRH